MNRQYLFQRASRFLVGVVAAALLAAVAVPHVHADGDGAHHPQTTCRACKLQDGFTAKAPSAPAVPLAAPTVVASLQIAQSAVIASPALCSASPRAPPALS
jgi:hypothetical protein